MAQNGIIPINCQNNQRRIASWFKMIRGKYQLFLFILIPLIWLFVFKYLPLAGLQIAFRKYELRSLISESKWVGIKYFTRFFSSYEFERVIKNTLMTSLYSLAASFPIPIILALCLNSVEAIRFKKFVQTLTYIPHFISTVVLVGMIIQFLNPRIGLYGIIYFRLTGSFPEDILGNSKAFYHLYVWSGIWQNMGWSSIVYMAALSSVDAQLHEAAQIDGASRFQRCCHVDLPSILPTATILLIMNSGSILSVGFEKAYLMQNSLNLETSEVISTYVYKVSIVNGTDFSYGTAIGLFNSLINLAVLSLVNYFAKRINETSLW